MQGRAASSSRPLKSESARKKIPARKGVDMNDAVGMDYIIDLGQFAQGTLSAKNPAEMCRSITRFYELLQKCGLPETAKTLEQTIGAFLKFDCFCDDKVLAEGKQRLYVLITQALQEAHEKQTIVLASQDVSAELRDLPNKRPKLTDTQKLLVEETIRCLDVHAYRSATVMGWNLSYDIVRQWIFDNQKGQFNTDLAARYPAMSVTITNYDDWFGGQPSEFQVLEACKAHIITGRLNDRLVHFLRDRNDCGHANFRNPTMQRTNCYIQDLLEVVT